MPAAAAPVGPAALTAAQERAHTRTDPDSGAPRRAIAHEHQQAIAAAVSAHIAEGRLPGCVIAIGRRDGVLLQRSYGQRAVAPAAIPMTVDTIFDVASLTKPIATAVSVMQLVERGQVDLNHPMVSYLPDAFGANRKRAVAVRHLLLHTGGFAAANSLRHYQRGPTRALQRVLDSPVVPALKNGFRYSDLGFIMLGVLVERISGTGLDRFAEANLFRPLGMRDTGFQPGPEVRSRIAPTTRRNGQWIIGDVHDPRAFRLGGVAGNAGLFSTAHDLARFARMMLGEGVLDGVRVLSPASVRAMAAVIALPDKLAAQARQRSPFDAHVRRGLGWSMRLRPERGFSPRTYGHGGYTGTRLWIDPENDLFVLFLSNRVHPNGSGDIDPLAEDIVRIATAAVGVTSATPGPVRTGIDVLRRDDYSQLRGARVGVITNTSGRTRDGQRTLDLLRAAPEVHVQAVFSPEHGLNADHEGPVANGVESASGAPVYSLFGPVRKPPPESLHGLDALVFDIQDVGTRFYTYMSTMRRAMEAAAEQGLRFVVLDRPNPLGGEVVEGPLVESQYESFVNHHTLPVRHGMTAGELAGLLNVERGINARLEIIPVHGWSRRMHWTDTGLPWVAPSPNLRTSVQVLQYPALGLLEATNISVGRGTNMPFEVLGAPWIDGPALARALTAAGLPGVRFEPVQFVPTASRHRHQLCHGIRVKVTDRDAFRPIRTGLTIARTLRIRYPETWNIDRMAGLLASQAVLDGLKQGLPVTQLEALWSDATSEFNAIRTRYLLYQ